ncbi:MAG: YggS family pyridoxal phosphate-dependent enzyme [Deinococcus sp.]|nr:YggS family pyridoxal phosphate-dependent enzyme [Deinococcus sp.]
MTDLAANLARLRARIASACQHVGRDPSSVRLVAVTKGQPAALAQAAVDAGILDLGENRIQEALAKIPLVSGARWHLIGHLQRNKVKHLAPFVLIHSVDSVRLAQALTEQAQALGRSIAVLVQVNVSGESSKFGVSWEEAPDLLGWVRRLEGLALQGLMTIAPLGDAEAARPYFHRLAQLARSEGLEELSMGMSGDFAVAIEEGATVIRVGTALFGARPATPEPEQ